MSDDASLSGHEDISLVQVSLAKSKESEDLSSHFATLEESVDRQVVAMREIQALMHGFQKLLVPRPPKTENINIQSQGTSISLDGYKFVGIWTNETNKITISIDVLYPFTMTLQPGLTRLPALNGMVLFSNPQIRVMLVRYDVDIYGEE